MDDPLRRERLDQLLDLAQSYRGWSRKQLATALRRDASNLCPASGLPKLDLIVGLAHVLDWSVESVVKSIWLEEIDVPFKKNIDLPEDFRLLEAESRAACRAGRHDEAVLMAQRALRLAKTGEEFAIAYTREASGWDGLGRYGDAMRASKRGLAQAGVSLPRRLQLQNNLANEYYTLWQPLEARTLSDDLVQKYERDRPNTRMSQVSQAFAYYVRGHSSRRLIALDPDQHREHAQNARTDLRMAVRLLETLADEFCDESYRGVAHTCRGGIIEVEVALGQRDAASGLDELSAGLSDVVDLNGCSHGDWLESYGWWCIYGCNIAMRHLQQQPTAQQHLAVFTNKADEIAERTDNWAVRERLVTMEYLQRCQIEDAIGVAPDWTIDTDDVRAIAGTMGRFPSFHETGWKILRSSRILRD